MNQGDPFHVIFFGVSASIMTPLNRKVAQKAACQAATKKNQRHKGQKRPYSACHLGEPVSHPMILVGD